MIAGRSAYELATPLFGGIGRRPTVPTRHVAADDTRGICPLAAVCVGLRFRWRSGPVDFETPAARSRRPAEPRCRDRSGLLGPVLRGAVSAAARTRGVRQHVTIFGQRLPQGCPLGPLTALRPRWWHLALGPGRAAAPLVCFIKRLSSEARYSYLGHLSDESVTQRICIVLLPLSWKDRPCLVAVTCPEHRRPVATGSRRPTVDH